MVAKASLAGHNMIDYDVDKLLLQMELEENTPGTAEDWFTPGERDRTKIIRVMTVWLAECGVLVRADNTTTDHFIIVANNNQDQDQVSPAAACCCA